jgi:hypothetical protein
MERARSSPPGKELGPGADDYVDKAIVGRLYNLLLDILRPGMASTRHTADENHHSST